MNPTTLPLFVHESDPAHSDTPTPAARSDAGFDAVGFEIGWDYARHRLTPPADHLHGPHPVRQGWEAGRATFGARTLKPNRHTRRWLQLRLDAWKQNLPFETLMVTPRTLAQIEPLQCPVTREVLTHDSGQPTDAVVLRLNPQAGFAAGHLATVSRRVMQALADAGTDAGWAAVQAQAEQARGQHPQPLAGLDAAQWERLAGLMSLSTPLPHERLATRPLRVLPPNRVHLINPVQALQALLTQLFLGEAYARRMTAVASLLPGADARRSYFLFMNAMLARRLAAGWSADRNRVRMALEDAWGHPVIERRWEQLALRLKPVDCERIVRLAVRRRLLGSTVRWLDDDAATEGWAVQPARPSGPQRPDAGATLALPAAPAAPATPGAHASATPGAGGVAQQDAQQAWRRFQRSGAWGCAEQALLV